MFCLSSSVEYLGAYNLGLKHYWEEDYKVHGNCTLWVFSEIFFVKFGCYMSVCILSMVNLSRILDSEKTNHSFWYISQEIINVQKIVPPRVFAIVDFNASLWPVRTISPVLKQRNINHHDQHVRWSKSKIRKKRRFNEEHFHLHHISFKALKEIINVCPENIQSLMKTQCLSLLQSALLWTLHT